METESHDPNGIATICFLTIANLDSPLGIHGHPQLLALIDYRRHVFAKRFRDKQPENSGLNHIAFEIPPSAFEPFLVHLQDYGLTVTQTEFPDMNARALFFDDPEGNRLELIANKN